jgi:hypothetical protein
VFWYRLLFATEESCAISQITKEDSSKHPKGSIHNSLPPTAFLNGDTHFLKRIKLLPRVQLRQDVAMFATRGENVKERGRLVLGRLVFTPGTTPHNNLPTILP